MPTRLAEGGASGALLVWHPPAPVTQHRRLFKLHIIQTCAPPSIPCVQPHRCPLQVWTYASRVAFVLSVTAKGQPIHEDIRLQRLQQLLLLRMSPDGNATVNTHKVR